ncbi:hypothetical protein PDE_02744 [Penicillium oxalicum 114-2]|uniref:A to I editase domain-containing protein n=1 Tax=Penicillium oxalicum (strain 114-2 / CGMCC 5302) TaxID=933388 RepID=S7ZB28_PENO1|nr:hypothetical protein PDE_02744 [Penicillium oxalicum 114-2]
MDSSPSSRPLASRIASLVHAHFDRLPARSKPKIFSDGSREWIPMTGIVAVKERTGAKCLPASQIPQCQGLVLHDCHAEILAIRAFNYWLLQECHALLVEEDKSPSSVEQEDGSKSVFIQRRTYITSGDDPSRPSSQPTVNWPAFEICPDIHFYMYCTCAPCGDASMELCMAAQEDASPWEVTRRTGSDHPSPSSDQPDPALSETMLDGRAHFSLLGIVRRKPARMDAEPTKSKSCSDKLALRQVSSLLSVETSHLVAPTDNVYLAGLVLPEDEISPAACARSFSETGRMGSLRDRSWPLLQPDQSSSTTGYRFRPFQILSVPIDEVEALWPFAKPKAISTKERQIDEVEAVGVPRKAKPGNVSSIWTAAPSLSHPCLLTTDTGSKTLPVLNHSKTGLYETVINGVKQGNRQANPTARGASSLSRAKLWGLLRNVLRSSECLVWGDGDNGRSCSQAREGLPATQDADSYEAFKRSEHESTSPLRVRQLAILDTKREMKGWVPNHGDEAWSLKVLVDSNKRRKISGVNHREGGL